VRTFHVIGPIGLVTTSLLAGALVVGSATSPAQGHVSPGLTRNILMAPASGGISLDRLAVAVRSGGGSVVAIYPVARSVVADIAKSWKAPLGVIEVPDRALHVTGSAGTASSDVTSTMRDTVGGAAADGGAGITVAVVDTGIASVPDLNGRISRLSVLPGPQGDGFGHGTFMAGLIAGSGASSAGRFGGIAPAAKLLDVRVASASGDTSLSLVLAGLQAVSDRRSADPSLRVLNLSLSEDSSVPPAFDPLSRALETLWAHGITVVVAAGNSGPVAGSVTAPGNDPVVLTVGALDESGSSSRSDDSVAAFSSWGDPFGISSKPDLVAPGVSLVSLRDPSSYVDANFPSARVGSSYFLGSGTSMSAAVTSGAVAVLLSKRPSLSPDAVKAVLTGSAYDVHARGHADGAGGLDLAAALTSSVRGGTGSGDDRMYAAPMGSSADAWAAFATAWSSGDWRKTQNAWAALPDDVRRWASQAWALSLVVNGSSDSVITQARAWSARSWSGRSWSSTDWLARAWSARSWSTDDWAARSWSARSWSARSWSDSDWSALTWSARSWSATTWSNDAWSVVGWGG